MGLLRWILEKCVLYGFVFAVFYVIGSFFGIVPEPIENFVSWLSQNFVFIALTVCVLAICYTIIRLSSRREANE
jgi:hypothetical protein